MWKVIFYGLVVHSLFLASIFKIYFQSPIIAGLQPQSDLKDPPANRLVLFITDGLRAESFYRDSAKLTPFLCDIILNHGIHGISHTRVPTESRPGHVALIAGMYEDPSAVLKGWQDNPVDFDSVFNRSKITYAWGSPDILSVFMKQQISSRMIATAYAADSEDFSGKMKSSSFDTWVFDKAMDFLHRHRAELQTKNRMVLFLHLLGLDTAGHVHKPNSELFDENLRIVDEGIKNVTNLINQIFIDGKTAFVLSADHGMSNKGAHGAGSEHETETPFIAWGAGVSYWKNINDGHERETVDINGQLVRRFDINQADAAPLMSALIGNAVPVNNIGQLPIEYLNTSVEYRCRCAVNNAMQIAGQFKHLQAQFRKSLFFSDFNDLNERNLLSLEYEIQTAIKSGSYEHTIKLSQNYMILALDGIQYFQSYYQNILLLAVSASMIGWIFYLYQQLEFNVKNEQIRKRSSKSVIVFVVAFTLVLSFIYVQNLPLSTGIFLILPIICWAPVKTFNMLRQLTLSQTWFWIAGIEFLVISFFNRFYLIFVLVGLLGYEYIILKEKKEKLESFFNWALNCAILAIFPALPMIDKDSHNFIFLLVGLIGWNLKLIATLKRGYEIFRIANAITFGIASLNFLWIIYDWNAHAGLSEIQQMISWIAMIISFVLPAISPNSFRDRMTAIISSLALPYALMSLSYESLFFMIFSSNIYYWVAMIYTDKKQLYAERLDETDKPRHVEEVDFKRAFISILYILVSFFGTGNIASISSFDPNWVRCFVSTFSPFLMATLIIIKLLIPVVLVMCAVRQIHSITKVPLDKFFIIILLCCDVMCLNFLFLVKNTGSWLEIGTSISHFVIMDVTVLVLCLLQVVAKFLTTSQLQFLFSGRRPDLSSNTPKIE